MGKKEIYRPAGRDPDDCPRSMLTRQIRFRLMDPVLYLAVIICILFAKSCKEPYFPEVEALKDLLIVEGLVTDQPGHSHVLLNYYHPGGLIPYLPIKYAVVHVKDDEGNTFDFRHDNYNPGKYIPLSGHFRARIGHSYTLHVDLAGEGRYETAPQEILPPAVIDEVYAKPVVRQVILDDFRGQPQRTWISGRDVFIGMSQKNSDILRLRMEPTLLLLYNWNEIIPPMISNIYYNWKKVKPSYINKFNLHRFDHGSPALLDHLLCFLPNEKRDYQLEPDENIYQHIMIIRYFTLNHEAYRFYMEAEKQLSSGNRLFDPVPGQLPSNIFCTSHPGRPVAGFFEASSMRSESYLQGKQKADFSYDFTMVEDMENVPVQGSWKNEKPPFWID